MLTEKIKEIKEEYYKEKESNIILNQQYKKLEEQEIEYKKQIPKKKKKEKNILNESNLNNTEKFDEYNDKKIIYNSL